MSVAVRWAVFEVGGWRGRGDIVDDVCCKFVGRVCLCACVCLKNGSG